MEFAADHFKVDARYGRVLYLQDYASYIKDSFVSELCDLDRDLMLSIDILPVPTDEAPASCKVHCWAWKRMSPTGSAARTPTTILPRPFLTIWNCSARKPRKCWTT